MYTWSRCPPDGAGRQHAVLARAKGDARVLRARVDECQRGARQVLPAELRIHVHRALLEVGIAGDAPCVRPQIRDAHRRSWSCAGLRSQQRSIELWRQLHVELWQTDRSTRA